MGRTAHFLRRRCVCVSLQTPLLHATANGGSRGPASPHSSSSPSSLPPSWRGGPRGWRPLLPDGSALQLPREFTSVFGDAELSPCCFARAARGGCCADFVVSSAALGFGGSRAGCRYVRQDLPARDAAAARG